MGSSVGATLLLRLGKKSYTAAVSMIGRLDDAQKCRVAHTLVDHGFAWVVAHSLEHFGRLDTALVVRLIEARQDLGGIVARNAVRLGWDPSRVGDALRSSGQEWALEHLTQD